MLALISLCALVTAHGGARNGWLTFSPGPLPERNPLKGYAAYLDSTPKLSGYASMAYVEAPWSVLEPREHEYRFDRLDARFERPLSKGKSIVLRLWLDWPSRPIGVPDWLVKSGLKLTPYTEYGGGLSPDYANLDLKRSLLEFIDALGVRYRNNRRVRFVELGLLGHWGEWHTYPHESLFAGLATQQLVVAAMHRAFPRTQLLGRYPSYKSLDLPWMGFHDDLIPDDTDAGPDWNFLPQLMRSSSRDNWKVAPIGGEMVPFNAKRLLSTDWHKLVSAVKRCHFSFIAGYCPVIEQHVDARFKRRSSDLDRLLGYSFRLSRARFAQQIRRNREWRYDIQGANVGVAPFYYRWPVRLALLRGNGSVAQQVELSTDIRSWLPGKLELVGRVRWHVPRGEYRLGIGVFDPGGLEHSMHFANRLPVRNGWTLMSRRVRVIA